ncbi:MAG: hypothetical protein ACXVIY_14265 [Mucilaginibacter sp.]
MSTNTEICLRVEDFFDLESWGPTVVFKFANLNTVLSHGMLLKKVGASTWKIIGMSTPKIRHSEAPCGKDQIMMSYRLEHLTGDKILTKGDRVYIES